MIYPHPETYFNGPMWRWFGLSYSSYLVVPRTLLCGLPLDLQQEFVDVLNQCSGIYDPFQINDNYTVILKDVRQRFTGDPLRHYRHPPQLPYYK